jgi:hypothetical protein
MSAGKTRQNPTKERSPPEADEHLEEDVGHLLASEIVFQQPDKPQRTTPGSQRR